MMKKAKFKILSYLCLIIVLFNFWINALSSNSYAAPSNVFGSNVKSQLGNVADDTGLDMSGVLSGIVGIMTWLPRIFGVGIVSLIGGLGTMIAESERKTSFRGFKRINTR